MSKQPRYGSRRDEKRREERFRREERRAAEEGEKVHYFQPILSLIVSVVLYFAPSLLVPVVLSLSLFSVLSR